MWSRALYRQRSQITDFFRTVYYGVGKTVNFGLPTAVLNFCIVSDMQFLVLFSVFDSDSCETTKIVPNIYPFDIVSHCLTLVNNTIIINISLKCESVLFLCCPIFCHFLYNYLKYSFLLNEKIWLNEKYDEEDSIQLIVPVVRRMF